MFMLKAPVKKLICKKYQTTFLQLFYETHVIFKRPTSLGKPSVADVDGDGNVEFFVPESKYIHVISYTSRPVMQNYKSSNNLIKLSFSILMLSLFS